MKLFIYYLIFLFIKSRDTSLNKCAYPIPFSAWAPHTIPTTLLSFNIGEPECPDSVIELKKLYYEEKLYQYYQ